MRNLSILFVFVFGMLSAQSQTSNFWTKKNDFSGGKRERAVAFAIGDYGYIATGVDTAENVLNDLWKYDPILDIWSQMANVPGPGRRDAVGFALGNKGYVGTGVDNDASTLGFKRKDFYEYDPLTNTWTAKSDYPGGGGNGIYFSAGFEIDSKGYVCCGKIGANQYSTQLWEYKPSIDQWTQRAPFPGGVRYQLTAFSIGNRGYVGLGANQDIFKKDFWSYNPGTNQWTQIANLPGSERGGAVSFSIGDRGYVCLGTDGGYLDDLWEYNAENNVWSVKANYGGSERKNAVGFVVNGKAYVGTGKGYSGKKASMEEYVPQSYLGISENELTQISVYPNPTSDVVKISTKNQDIHTFKLITSTGRLVQEVENNSFSTVEMMVSEHSRGMYILAACDENGQLIMSKQIILQ